MRTAKLNATDSGVRRGDPVLGISVLLTLSESQAYGFPARSCSDRRPKQKKPYLSGILR